MTSGLISRRREFTPLPSRGHVFVCLLSPQKVRLERVTPSRVHPICSNRARISLLYEISQRYFVNIDNIAIWANLLFILKQREKKILMLY